METAVQSPAETLLPLDAPERLVSFQEAGSGRIFTFTFRRITAKDWEKYFAGIVIESWREEGARVDRVDVRSAQHWLFDECVVRVEGYRLRAVEFMQLPNWKDRVRYGHRLLAVEKIQDVSLSKTPGPEFEDPDFEEVRLDALWGAQQPGRMKKYVGLVHRFSPLTAEHKRRLDRSLTESRVVGGGRCARTIYPVRQALLVKLYDDLIVNVDGYGVAGREIDGVQQIRQEMDAFHKVAAVQQLFAAPEDAEEAGAA